MRKAIDRQPAERDLDFVTHVSALAINPEGKMPIALQWQNHKWSLPKGRLELHEKPRDGLYRKFTDETGILGSRLEDLELFAIADRRSAGRAETHEMAYFLGHTMAKGALHPKGADIRTGEWVTPNEALALLHNPTDIEVLEGAIPHLEARLRQIRVDE